MTDAERSVMRAIESCHDSIIHTRRMMKACVDILDAETEHEVPRQAQRMLDYLNARADHVEAVFGNFKSEPEFKEIKMERYGTNYTREVWTVPISRFWERSVMNRGLHSGVDIGGRPAFVTHAKVASKQPFTDEHIELLEASMVTVHVKSRENTWGYDTEVKRHDKYIAIETCPTTGKRYMATGNTPNWARRTLNGRNKKELLDTLLGDL